MNNIFIQIIMDKRIINLTLEDVQEMEIRPDYSQLIGSSRNVIKFNGNTEITFKCEKVTNMPRIRNR